MSAPPRALELTPRGAGGVAVVLLTGPGALERARELAPDARLEPGRMALARLAVDGEPLDEALVCVLAPERVELHVHGSPPLVARLLDALGAEGRAHGPPGAEGEAGGAERLAWELLAAAPCEAGARILLDQAEGALARRLDELAGAAEGARLEGLRELARSSRALRFALAPPTVVLAGAVNAGKSTLFNALVGRRRVVVGEEEGTTRDVVVERVRCGAYAVDLVDGAGERAAEGAVERAGIELARRVRARADLVLWLAAPGAAPPPARAEGEPPRALLATQTDRLPEAARPADGVSVATRPELARARVEELVHAALALDPEPWRPGRAALFEPRLLAGAERLVARADGGGAAPSPEELRNFTRDALRR